MNELIEVVENPVFGRWRNMTEWFEEATAITEKSLTAAGVPETIPVPGKWEIKIYIPGRISGDYCLYGEAMEVALALLTEMGMRPADAYGEHAHCVICLEAADFYQAKWLAEQIHCWFRTNGFRAIVGGNVYEKAQEDKSAYIEVRVLRNTAPQSGKWSLIVAMPKNEGLQLAAELGLIAKEGGRLAGGYIFAFDVEDFSVAGAKAAQAIDWLCAKGYDTQISWGDIDLPIDALDHETLRALNGTGRWFHKQHEAFSSRSNMPYASVELRDRKYSEGDEWVGKLKRLRARLEGQAEQVTLSLTRAQVRALVDLAGDVATHCGYLVQSTEDDVQGQYHVSHRQWELFNDANQVGDSLVKILAELRRALGLNLN